MKYANAIGYATRQGDEVQPRNIESTLSTIDLRSSDGLNVMITSFCDFRPFSAKKLAFFSKTNFMIKFLHHLALF
jgi:hypothetical protein